MKLSPELSLDELREIVLSRKDEVIAILHQAAVEEYGQARILSAECDARIARLKAEIIILSTAQKRLADSTSAATAARSTKDA
jgi:hypothetical protein